MTSKIILSLVLGVALIAAGVAGIHHLLSAGALRARFLSVDPDTIADDPALTRYALRSGEAGYRDRCMTCHGPNMHGDPKRGVPNLIDQDWLYGTGRVSEIERVVRYGIRSGLARTQNLASMPGFARAVPYPRYQIEPLTQREVADVAALIYSFQHPDAVDADTRARGNAIFQGKGYCFDCHSADGGGDPAIGAPNLRDAVWLVGDGSLPSIRFTIENGMSGDCPAFALTLSAERIRAIAVYVHRAGVS